MKYYQLTKDLPTFEKGEIFYIGVNGNLASYKDPHIVAYAASTLEKFPNILEDWFIEVPEPERDAKTKYAFMEYLSDHRGERFFQAVRNFTNRYLDDTISHVYASNGVRSAETPKDTFYWECDEMLKDGDMAANKSGSGGEAC